MRTLKIIVSTFIVMVYVAAISGEFAHGQRYGNFNSGAKKNTYIEVTGKVLQRPGGGSDFIVIEDSITEQPLLSSTDVTDLGGAAGLEAKIGWLNRYGGAWEFRTNLGSFQNGGNVTAPSGARVESPLFTGSADSAGYDYSSDFFSIELSKRVNIKPGCTWSIGPRFMSVKENFTFTTATDAGAFNFTTSNNFKTSNAIFGGQIGLEINRPVFQNCIWNVYGRIGGYGNPTSLETTSQSTLFLPNTTKSTKWTGTLLAEVGGAVKYQIIPSCLSAFVGYEACWIDGIALAPSQALSVGETEIITNTTPFWQSINFGYEFNF